MVRKFTFFRKYLWLFGIAAEYAHYQFSMHTDFVTVPLMFNFIGSYMLGAWIGVHYEAIIEKMTKKKMIIARTSGLLLGLTYVFIRYRNTYFERLPIDPDYYKMIGILFKVIGSLFFFYFAEYLVRWSSQKVFTGCAVLRTTPSVFT